MADVLSRIVLQAQGGDQVAREVGKIKQAYKEAGAEASKMGASGGVGGGGTFAAFDKAVMTNTGLDISSRRTSNQEYDRRLSERMGNHQQMAQQNTRAAASSRIGQVGGAATSMMSGDVVGGGSQAMSMLAGAGTIGMIAAALVAVGVGTKKLAEKEEGRQQFFGRGLSQSLGFLGNQGWDRARGMLLNLEESGIPRDMLVQYMTGLAGAGGTLAGTDAEATAALAGQYAFSQGVDPATLGRFQAIRQKAGLGPITAGQMSDDINRGTAAFGQAGLTPFLSAVSTAIETSMARGIKAGSFGRQAEYDTYQRMISGLGSIGGMTIEGAAAVYQRMQQSVIAGQNLGRPEDVFQFMQFRRPGQTYGETIRAMSASGAEREIYRNLRAQAGGNREALEILVQRQFGLDWQAVPGFIDTMDDQVRDPSTRVQFGAGPEIAISNELRETVQRQQNAIGQGVQRGANKILNRAYQFFTGGAQGKKQAQLSPIEVAQQNALADMYGSNLMYLQGESPEALAAMLPSSIRPFATAATTGDAAFYAPMLSGQVLPQLAAFSQFKAGKGDFTEAQKATMSEYAPIYEMIVQTLSNPEVVAALTSPQGASKIQENIRNIDAENLAGDNLDLTVTIVEILMAINETLGITSVTDEGTTE
jgi:hypothetical protein